jgi:hypothetical protein
MGIRRTSFQQVLCLTGELFRRFLQKVIEQRRYFFQAAERPTCYEDSGAQSHMTE